MPQIGEFTRDGLGYSGHVRSALIDLAVVIVAAEKPQLENAPDFRIHRGDAVGPEIGAAWKRTSEKAGDYLSLVIDDPSLPQPLRANLFRTGDTAAWHLQWSRLQRRAEKADSQ